VTRPAAAPAPALTPQVVSQIKKRVESTCGKKGRKVDLKVLPNHEVQVRFSVRTEADGQELGRQIINLPELAPYKVDLKVSVE
jgi:hypothetical protein